MNESNASMVGVLRPRPPGFRPTEETAARTIHQSDIHPLILLCNRQDGKLFIASCKKNNITVNNNNGNFHAG